ncbi:glycosyltransferase family 4 protein [Bacteroides acidifaciens]|uniref:Putative glycosyltransferase EpsD n=2 Tax=Bacteroides acidifaciens TaxID=85831 RepID=A0A7I9ZXI6_9BACE|nr:glycosyltransferase family 4 protein [Bacteroides acidifaciens]MCR1998407.1 glycosyltransferase family 4 protein [Bacteroides acidifaciens]GFH84855.1 putative glycosyltransferase EpsD [Bacteroides acidifaciens]
MTKKILLVATVQSHIAQFHRPLSEVLHAHGYEVHAAARNNLAEKNGLQLDFVDKVFDVRFSRSPKSKENITAYNQLKTIVDSGNYEVVHCNTPMGGMIARLATRAARKKGTKLFYTAHGFHFYDGAPKKNWMIFYPIEKFFSKMTDILITITHEDYKVASEAFHCKVAYMHGVGVSGERYKPVTIEEKLSLRGKMGYSKNAKILLCIGELNDNKNQSMAIRMMHKVVAKYPEAILLLAGNGPKQKFLEQLIKQEGLERNVKLIGYVTNLQDYQHIIDVQVSCSLREGLPLNIVESMLSGNPVVASLNRGHRELIQDGINGYIVDPNDYEAMGNRVLNLLDNDDLCKRIVQNAIIFAQDFTFTSVKKELEEIYFGK